jgi:hypothetical protein
MREETLTVEGLFQLGAQTLKDDFEKIRKSMPHHGVAGQETENLLIDFLNERLPRRFSAVTGLVIDTENSLSKQCDVLIYDAENSPVYRAGSVGQILPSDSIAAVIQVKSKLSKAELKDAAENIASVKKLQRSPITNLDQPVNFSNFIVNNSLGVVFAYDSKTSLKALAKNLKEINKKLPRAQWIDVVVVLGKGMLSYCMQFPGEKKYNNMMPEASADFSVPACYVHLCLFEDSKYALNRFFMHLMSVLSFYRKRTALPFESILGGAEKTATTIQGYWYTTDRNLVEVPDSQIGKGEDPLIVFNVFHKNRANSVGQFSQYKWSDGYIYQVIPPNNDALTVLGILISLTGQKNCNAVPVQDGVMAHTNLLNGIPPRLDQIKQILSRTPFEVR